MVYSRAISTSFSFSANYSERRVEEAKADIDLGPFLDRRVLAVTLHEHLGGLVDGEVGDHN